MALVNLGSALRKTVNSLRKCNPGQGLEILSYKRNRGVTIIRSCAGGYRMIERGYIDQDMEVSERQIARQLKSAMKREFPRSRKVRIYCLKDAGQAGLERKKL